MHSVYLTEMEMAQLMQRLTIDIAKRIYCLSLVSQELGSVMKTMGMAPSDDSLAVRFVESKNTWLFDQCLEDDKDSGY